MMADGEYGVEEYSAGSVEGDWVPEGEGGVGAIEDAAAEFDPLALAQDDQGGVSSPLFAVLPDPKKANQAAASLKQALPLPSDLITSPVTPEPNAFAEASAKINPAPVAIESAKDPASQPRIEVIDTVTVKGDNGAPDRTLEIGHDENLATNSAPLGLGAVSQWLTGSPSNGFAGYRVREKGTSEWRDIEGGAMSPEAAKNGAAEMAQKGFFSAATQPQNTAPRINPQALALGHFGTLTGANINDPASVKSVLKSSGSANLNEGLNTAIANVPEDPRAFADQVFQRAKGMTSDKTMRFEETKSPAMAGLEDADAVVAMAEMGQKLKNMGVAPEYLKAYNEEANNLAILVGISKFKDSFIADNILSARGQSKAMMSKIDNDLNGGGGGFAAPSHSVLGVGARANNGVLPTPRKGGVAVAEVAESETSGSGSASNRAHDFVGGAFKAIGEPGPALQGLVQNVGNWAKGAGKGVQGAWNATFAQPFKQATSRSPLQETSAQITGDPWGGMKDAVGRQVQKLGNHAQPLMDQLAQLLPDSGRGPGGGATPALATQGAGNLSAGAGGSASASTTGLFGNITRPLGQQGQTPTANDNSGVVPIANMKSVRGQGGSMANTPVKTDGYPKYPSNWNQDTFWFDGHNVGEYPPHAFSSPVADALNNTVQTLPSREALVLIVKKVDQLDAPNSPKITPKDAVMMVTPKMLDEMLFTSIDQASLKPDQIIMQGALGVPGAGTGKVVTSLEGSKAALEANDPYILVMPETGPELNKYIRGAAGVITTGGGMTSHAAIMTRQYGVPGIIGAKALEGEIKAGDTLSIDGLSGTVARGTATIIQPDPQNPHLQRLLEIADSLQSDVTHRMGIYANTDTPQDAALALQRGAQAVGAARTEHTVLGENTLPWMQGVFLAKTTSDRQHYLDQLFPSQKENSKGLMEVMDGRKTTIRLFDLPTHEAMPTNSQAISALATRLNLDPKDVSRDIHTAHEANPMIGKRGIVQAVMYPEIYEMQIRAIFEAAAELKAEGKNPQPAILIPMVSEVGEVKFAKEMVDRIAQEVRAKYPIGLPEYQLGIMVEIPVAVDILPHVREEINFFSGGSNDLTQLTLGKSREDTAEPIELYLQHGIYDADPSQTLHPGVAKRFAQAASLAGPDCPGGVCGEHGANQPSTMMAQMAGMGYMSGSPSRLTHMRFFVPQAMIRHEKAILADRASVAQLADKGVVAPLPEGVSPLFSWMKPVTPSSSPPTPP
jgi:phosphoenolpyruvate-protein kinase (PTS system EI component)